MLPRRAPSYVAAVAVLAALTGCGNVGRTTPDPKHATPVALPTVNPTVYSATPSPTEAPRETSRPSGTATATTTPAPGGGGNEVAATDTNKFEPAEISVKVGTKVTWTNGSGFHTVTGGEVNQPDAASPINGQLTSPGATYEVTFDKAGTFPYFCQPHASLGMTGTVTVT